MRHWSKGTKRSRSTSKSSLRRAQGKLSAPKKRPSPKAAAALPAPTPSEAAFEAAFRAFDAGTAPRDAAMPDDAATDHAATPDHAATAFVERVFAKSEQYLRDQYSTIGDAHRFHTKIAGVSFEGRQDTIAGLSAGAPLELRRQRDNPHDPNAIAVHYGNLQLGFLNKRMAAQIAPLIDAGARYRARVASLTGGPGRAGEPAKHRGVNLLVERDASGGARSPHRPASAPGIDSSEAEELVRSALIGTAQPHDAQRAVLDRVNDGKNTLAVLGTGRGKSFCFQFSAALRAFGGGGRTLVVYPLRALANDQYEALRRTLDPLGLRIFRANGSIGSEEREELFDALREGEWDVVLATPEFLEFHRDALRGRSKPSFVVVDEAHHIHESRHRPAYARLAATIRALGEPQILALTATAAEETFRRIVDDLRVDAWVIDPTVRENLHVADARGTRDKIGYLTELFGPRGDARKGIVYCNSRTEVVKVAQRLRRALGNEVMFYHAKMPNAERLEAERLFREGSLRVMIATSAFGEGIDLPDVSDVVLYHLNFDFGEFNQQAGRAGRDGAPARIHLLYGQSDRSLNEWLIDIDAPPIAQLRELYRGLKGLARPSTGSGQAVVRGGDAEIAGILDIDRVRDRTITAALRIFRDAGLVEVEEDDEGRCIRLLPVSGRIEMESNERYAEGEATREAFVHFAEAALSASAGTLERIINRPIYPSGVPLTR